MITQEVIQAPTRNLNEQEMIEHLKGKGYKILKQTWDEL
jgi:hypothetical protein